MITRRAELGSISSGTLRVQDLLQAFADVLESLDVDQRYVEEVHDARQIVEWFDYLNDAGMEFANVTVDDLQDALNECAPEGAYFGAHEGDGADFGFWPCPTDVGAA